jgi:hypothetical protein
MRRRDTGRVRDAQITPLDRVARRNLWSPPGRLCSYPVMRHMSYRMTFFYKRVFPIKRFGILLLVTAFAVFSDQ